MTMRLLSCVSGCAMSASVMTSPPSATFRAACNCEVKQWGRSSKLGIPATERHQRSSTQFAFGMAAMRHTSSVTLPPSNSAGALGLLCLS